jgi:O-acetyl-ADP-ribose deacetylase (regulator of RNase III)
MLFEIIERDITTMAVDAIVNAANGSLLGGGGVDGAIHRAAGSELLKECITLGGCKTGKAKITRGYNLPAKHVIHTVGPVYRGGNNKEEALLRLCYKNALRIAKRNKLKSIAFPLISAGVYGYPKDEALSVAVDEIRRFLEKNEMTVYLTIFDKASFVLSERLIGGVSEYIEKNYAHAQAARQYSRKCYLKDLNFVDKATEPDAYGDFIDESEDYEAYEEEYDASEEAEESGTYVIENFSLLYNTETEGYGANEEEPTLRDLKSAIERLDQSFSEALLGLITDKGKTDPEVYKRANIDRRHFSKMRSDNLYAPSKSTVLALAVALELTVAETDALLARAGFALSHSRKFDVIVEYFIKNKRYDIFEINEVLFHYDQPLLGG